jgi:transketolase
MQPDFAKLARECSEIRNAIIDMAHAAGSGHCGGSLSATDIIWTLYNTCLSIKPADPSWEDRDRFVLSKGHAAPALYAALARKGFFPTSQLLSLRKAGSFLQGHPDMKKTPGIDMSTGSLGMGISAGVGMALAGRLSGKKYHTFVLAGDGELQEGQNWEGLMAAAKFNLTNLTVIVDNNNVQLDGTCDEIMPMGDLTAKLSAFGFDVRGCNGHDCRAIYQAALWARSATTRPRAIIAHTIKGKGVSFMEGQAAWHGKPLSESDYDVAKKDLATTGEAAHA